MTDRLLYDWGPIVALAIGVLFLVDLTLTLRGAKASHAVRSVWDFEGSYELNPMWQAQIDRGIWISRRFVVVLGVILGLLLVSGWYLHGVDEHHVFGDVPFGMWTFALLSGAVLLLQLPTVMNHVANLVTFQALQENPTAVSGGLKLRRWFVYRQSWNGYLRFAGLWLVLFALTWQVFFLGGVLGCLGTARRFRLLEGKARSATATAPEPLATEPPATELPATEPREPEPMPS